MITLLNVDEFVRKLDKVTQHVYFNRPNEFHAEGLFSEKIFGVLGSNDRKKTYSYIDLNAKVIHPTALDIIARLDRRIGDFLSTEKIFSLDDAGTLIEDPDGVTGISNFIEMLPKIKFRGGTSDREKFIKFIDKVYKDGTLFIDKLIIIPPEIRPAYQNEQGEWVIDNLNTIYQNIMKRTTQVKSSGKNGELFDLLNYELQKAVNDHDKYIRTRIEKKEGLIRNQMLGKRIDFSGRAVITPDPNLGVSQVGVPFALAISLFEPFIIYQLINSGKIDQAALSKELYEYTGTETSTDAIQRVFKAIKYNDKIPAPLYEIFYQATEMAMVGRTVLAKRDPVLQTQSYMGYEPVLHRGNTITICTTQVGPHNADFDGDTMAIFHPLTNEAQIEARDKMKVLTSGTTFNALAFGLSMEMWVGLYTLTKSKKSSKSPLAVDDEFLKNTTDPYQVVKYKGHTTTAGIALFNSCFPSDFPFVNDQATKGRVNKMIAAVSRKYEDDVIREVVNRLEKLAFKWATISGASITIDVLELPASVYKIKDKLEKATPEEADVLLKAAWEITIEHLHDTGFGDLIESGSSKGVGQVSQILIAKGIIADPAGNVLDPIAGSYSDGLSNKEYFNASSGARKGIADRVLNTAATGYMSRKLAFVLNSVEADQFTRDCKTTKTLPMKLSKGLKERLQGRYIVGSSGKLELFDPNDYKLGDVIHLRSPIYCKNKKVCFTCYGHLLERHRTPFVGILAAQVIGERGTQMIMKTFHTGGAVELMKHDMIQDIIDGDPLANLEK